MRDSTRLKRCFVRAGLAQELGRATWMRAGEKITEGREVTRKGQGGGETWREAGGGKELRL